MSTRSPIRLCPAHLEHHGFDSRRGLVWAVSRPVRPIIQAFQSVAFVARQPTVHHRPRDVPIPGHLAHRQTVVNYRYDHLVPLLSHAHLPHARESDKSAEVTATHQPKVCDASGEGLLGPISRTYTLWWCSRRESNPEPWD